MKRYCVWDWGRLQYWYYQAPGLPDAGWDVLGGNRPQRQKVRGEVSLETVLPELPVDARLIGSGVHAVGQVCRARRKQLQGPQINDGYGPAEMDLLLLLGALIVGIGVGSVGGGLLRSVALVGSGFMLGRRR